MATRLKLLRSETMFFAYDTPDDLEPLQQAGKHLLNAGFTKQSHIFRAYVLCGHKGDTQDKTLTRFKQTWEAGFMPMAMLFRDKKENIQQKGSGSKESGQTRS